MGAAACAVRMCKGSHFFVSVKERRGKVWNEAGGGCEVAREYESRVWRAFGEAWEGLRREYVFLILIDRYKDGDGRESTACCQGIVGRGLA